MTNILRRALRLVDNPGLEPDNDPFTAHKSLDVLADIISRSDIDLLSAQTELANTKERTEREMRDATQAVANAISDRERAHAAFLARCSEKFCVDLVLPGEIVS